MDNVSSDEEECAGDVEVIEADVDDFEWEDVDTETEVEDENIDDEDENIIELEHSDALITFKSHNDAVICCSISPDSNTILTGGQDDCAYLWNGETGEIIHKCEEHNDTVATVGFSHDGKYYATSDMNGLLQVWDIKTHEKVLTTESSSEIVWLKWHPNKYVILAGTESGEIWLWDINIEENLQVFASNGERSDCGTFLPDGERAIVGYSDGSLKIFNLKDGRILHRFKNPSAHKGLVTVVDCYVNNILCASGSQDCTVKILNTKSNDVVSTLQCFKSKGDDLENGVEAIAFQSDPNECVLATGNLKGSIQIWDVARSTAKMELDNEAGVVKLIWHPKSPLVYSAGLDGVVRRWDSRNGETSGKWMGHTRKIFDMELNKNGTRLVTSSEDKTSCVFNVGF